MVKDVNTFRPKISCFQIEKVYFEKIQQTTTLLNMKIFVLDIEIYIFIYFMLLYNM